jgi:predicted  nucleic acid-binding Zn-ribbon protein
MTNNEYQQLVEFLGRQFAEIDQRFTVIDQRFTGIDQRFTGLDQRFVAIDQRFVTMEQRFEARFDTIEQQLRDVLGHFDEVYRRLERLEQEYYAITQGLRRIETLLVDERGKREILEQSLDELKRQALALQGRIDELEQQLRRP